MAEFRTLKMNLWSDPFIESLSPMGKLLYLYLITSPHTNNMGILEVSRKRISIDTGMDDKSINAGMDFLKKSGKVVEVDGVIWLVKFIPNQTSCSPKIVEGLKRLSEQIKSPKLRRLIWQHYPYAMKVIPTGGDGTYTLSDGMDTLSIPTPELELEVESELEEEEEEERNKYICASENDSSASSPSKTEYDNRLLEAFQKFWEIYPRKINKKAAEKAWMALFRSAPKSTHADLMRGVALHIDDYKDDIEERGTEERFIKHPATWLRAVDFLEPPIRGAV